MVTAHVEPFHQRQLRLLATLWRYQRKRDVFAVGEALGLIINEVADFVTKIADKRRYAVRPA
jgi:hypothetical protein